MVVVVEGVATGVHEWWRVPVHAAGAGVDAVGPAQFGEPVVRSAAECEVGGVGEPAVVPAGVGVMGLAVTRTVGAAGAGAPTVAVVEQ